MMAIFDPSSYGNVYNVGTLFPLTNPFLFADLFSGIVSREVNITAPLQGHVGSFVAEIANVVRNSLLLFSDDDKIVAQAKKQILYDGSNAFKQNYFIYDMVQRILSLTLETKRANPLRQIARELGDDNYNPPTYTRNSIESIQWILFGKNPPYIGDKKSKPVYVPSTPSRSGGRPKGNRSGSRF